MSRIEWQPLAIPDIAESAIRAQQLAGQTLGNAFSGITGVIDQWEGSQRDKNMAELIARQEAFAGKDSALYDAARQSGALTRGLTYIRPEQLAASVRGYGEALERDYRGDVAYADQRTDRVFALGERDRAVSEREAGIAVQRGLYDLEGRLATGQITREQYNAEAAPLLAQAATAAQIGDIRESRTRGVGEYQSGVQFQRGTYTWDRNLRDDRQKDRAAEILNEITRDNIDGTSALTALNNNYGNEDAEVLNAIREAIPNMFTTLDSVTAPIGAGAALPGGGGESMSFAAPEGGFAGGATESSRVLNYEARAAGFNSLPANIRTVGQVSDYARQMNRAGVASSATGTYQIVGQTLRGRNNVNGYAERVLGAGWRDVDWTPAVEDRIAEAIFNDHRNSATALRQQWVSLSPREAERVRQMPWAEARRVIAAGESGARIPPAASASSLRDSQMNLSTGLSNRTDAGEGGSRVANAAGYMQANARPDADAQTIANELVGEGGAYSGAPQHRIRADIERLANETGVSYAVAGWALSGTRRNRNMAERAFLGPEMTAPDFNAAKQRIQSTNTQEMRDTVQTVQANVEAQAAIQTAQAADAAARTRYADALARREANGGRGDVSRYAAAVQATSAALASAQAQANDPTLGRVEGARASAPSRDYQRSYVQPTRAPAPTRSYVNGAAGPPRQSFAPGVPVSRGPSVSVVAPPARRPQFPRFAPRTSTPFLTGSD